MIEILGVKLGYEAVIFFVAFAASEVIGESNLKENSVLGLVKKLIDSLKSVRTEDEKIEAIKEKVVAVVDEVKTIGE